MPGGAASATGMLVVGAGVVETMMVGAVVVVTAAVVDPIRVVGWHKRVTRLEWCCCVGVISRAQGSLVVWCGLPGLLELITAGVLWISRSASLSLLSSSLSVWWTSLLMGLRNRVHVD